MPDNCYPTIIPTIDDTELECCELIKSQCVTHADALPTLSLPEDSDLRTILNEIDTYLSSGGASTFLELTDTPSAYTGEAGNFTRVNVGETALEFFTLADVAITNDYNDLDNLPSVITNTSDLINDGEDGVNPFITANDIEEYVFEEGVINDGSGNVGIGGEITEYRTIDFDFISNPSAGFVLSSTNFDSGFEYSGDLILMYHNNTISINSDTDMFLGTDGVNEIRGNSGIDIRTPNIITLTSNAGQALLLQNSTGRIEYQNVIHDVIEGTNISIDKTDPFNPIISASGSAGEANTYSDLGLGEGITGTKTGVDLPFKSLVGGTNITLTSDANTVTISTDEGQIEQSLSFSLNNTHNNKVIIINNGVSAVNITVDTSLSNGFKCGFIQRGTGTVTFVASGTTLNTANGLIIEGQYNQAFIEKRNAGTNEFFILGNTTT